MIRSDHSRFKNVTAWVAYAESLIDIGGRSMRASSAGLNCLRVAAACAVFLLIAPLSQARAQAYVFTDLGTLGGTQSIAYGINGLGQVVGHALRAGDVQRQATMWNAGTVTNLAASPNDFSLAYAINDAGMSVGQSLVGTGIGGFRATVWSGGTSTVLAALPDTVNSDAWAVNNSGQVAGRSVIVNRWHATVWNGGVPTDLGAASGSDSSYAYGINDSGQVAGTASYGSYSRATVWNGGVPTVLGTLGGANGGAWAINASGQVAGYSDTVGGFSHATIWNGLVATDLGTLGGNSSQARAINNLGQVVGLAQTATGAWHTTLWTGTDVVDLSNVASLEGWVLSDVYGINDSGWIVGYAGRSDALHAFLLTPVPEPETFALLLVGLGVLRFAVRRRRAA